MHIIYACTHTHAIWYFCITNTIYSYCFCQLRVEREENERTQKGLEEKSQRIEELLSALNASRESEMKLDETYRQELVAQKKLADIYQGMYFYFLSDSDIAVFCIFHCSVSFFLFLLLLVLYIYFCYCLCHFFMYWYENLFSFYYSTVAIIIFTCFYMFEWMNWWGSEHKEWVN